MAIHLSQIYIEPGSTALPPLLAECQSAIRSLVAHDIYTLYDELALREFIEKNFHQRVLLAFQKLKPFSYKSDLGRFCILYHYGGWYFDVAIRPSAKMDINPRVGCLLFREYGRMALSSWGVSTGVIYSRPGNPIFRHAIDMVVEHCASEFYGATALCPTGPNLLGRAVALVNRPEEIVFGDVTPLTPAWSTPNKAFVLPSGGILAYSKNLPAGELKSLGVTRGNNYRVMYDARDIYDQSIQINMTES